MAARPRATDITHLLADSLRLAHNIIYYQTINDRLILIVAKDYDEISYIESFKGGENTYVVLSKALKKTVCWKTYKVPCYKKKYLILLYYY